MESNGVSTGIDATGPAAPAGSGADVRTFLIVDVRGYTRFTQARGDEEAGRLAASFAALVREVVTAAGGEVIELRGDEALCVFRSARQALRAAVDLQVRFRSPREGQPAFPLGIGIGLDAGEAVPVEGGYRGGALNLAARLCGIAAGGEILASETVASLARRVEGMSFVERRGARLKGLEERVRVIEVVPDVELPPLPGPPTASEKGRRRRVLIAAGIAALAVPAAVVGVLLVREDTALSAAPNSVAVIDPRTNGVVDTIAVGDGPNPIAASRDAVWVVNVNDKTLMKIDAAAHSVVESVGLPAPTGWQGTAFRVAAPPRDVWVHACPITLWRISPGDGQISQELEVAPNRGVFYEISCAIAVDRDSVWTASEGPPQLVRVATAATSAAAIAERFPRPDEAVSAIAPGAGSVWLAEAAGAIRRIDPRTGAITKTILLDPGLSAMTFAYGAVWVVNKRENSVARIRPRTNSVVYAIPVGEDPVAIAAGGGALWVANSGSGTVSRIDPETNTVTKTIEVGNRPLGVAVGADQVWVTVRS